MYPALLTPSPLPFADRKSRGDATTEVTSAAFAVASGAPPRLRSQKPQKTPRSILAEKLAEKLARNRQR